MIYVFSLLGILAGTLAQELTISENKLVLPGSDITLSCGSGRPIYSCSWTLPSGSTCRDLKPDLETQCRKEPSVFFNGSSSSCDITVKDVQRLHSGQWSCGLKYTEGGDQSDIQTQVDVFAKADVDWKDIYGVITVTEGSPVSLICRASHSRPAGKFSWHYGADPETNRIINNQTPTITQLDQPGLFDMEELLLFDPKPEHDGEKIYCSYKQYDLNGGVLDSMMVDIDLRVEFLDIVRPAQLPPLQSGSTGNLSVEVHGSPAPEISWIVEGDEVHLLTKQNPTVLHYTLLELVELQDEKNRYLSTLLIYNVSVSDMNNVYKMQVESSKDALEGMEEVRIVVDTAWPEEIEQPSQANPSTTVIVVVSVIIVLVICIITTLTVLYAKKNGKWCFQNSYQHRQSEPQDQVEPLQGQASSIIKPHPYSRPS